MFPTMMVSCLASRDYKVILSGDGGDELFWGYPERFGSLIEIAKDSRLPFWWRRIRGGIQRVLGLKYQSTYLPRCSLEETNRRMATHFSEFWLRQVFPTLPCWPSE